MRLNGLAGSRDKSFFVILFGMFFVSYTGHIIGVLIWVFNKFTESSE
jgi:hypothetical protein